jgi:hypothetical protein
VRVAELLLQQREAFGLFERREVFALDVLDECDLELLAIVDVELDGRDLVESRERGGAIAALARGSARARPFRARSPRAPRCCRVACAAAPRSAR